MNKQKLPEYHRQLDQNTIKQLEIKYVDLISRSRKDNVYRDMWHANEVFRTNKNQLYRELKSQGLMQNESHPFLHKWRTCEKSLDNLIKKGKTDYNPIYQLEYVVKKSVN